jgi:hypothetical protein
MANGAETWGVGTTKLGWALRDLDSPATKIAMSRCRSSALAAAATKLAFPDANVRHERSYRPVVRHQWVALATGGEWAAEAIQFDERSPDE